MSHPGGLSGVVHRTSGVRVINTKGLLGFGGGWPGPLPEPPAAGTDLTLVCLSVTLHRAATHSCGDPATSSASSFFRGY